MIKNLKKGILGLFLAAVMFTGSFSAFGSDENAVSSARYGVVRIRSEGPDGTGSLGTGFGVGKAGEDADIFVTNWHVVTSSGTYDPDKAKVYILLDDESYNETRWVRLKEGEKADPSRDIQDEEGQWFRIENRGVISPNAVECEVLYSEKEYPDVAVLRTKTPIRNVKALPLRPVSQSYVGKNIYAIGYPGTADIGSTVHTDDTITKKIKASVEAVTITGGVVSRCLPLESVGDTECIVHDAHINHGNSGGPLILEDGSVIGINTYTYGETASEYNVSIYIDYAMEVLDQLGIEYSVAGETGKKTVPVWILMGGTACAAIVLVLIFHLKKSREEQKAVGQTAATGTDPVSVREIRLQGIKGVFAGRRFSLEPEIFVGRDPQTCKLVYPPKTKGISGVHCVLRVRDGDVTVEDRGSTYGTMVNGRSLKPGEKYPLSPGDILSLGSENESFQITEKNKTT